MRTLLFIVILTVVVTNLGLAQTIEFSNRKDKVTVYEGDTVLISADTAFVLNKSRAKWLNYQLDELQKIKLLYTDLKGDHGDLISDVETIQKQLDKIIEKSKQDSIIITKNLDNILNDLETTLAEFKTNNELLKTTNADLNKQVNNLEKIIKDLKKESRWIWWNGAADKLITFAGGIGIGLLIGLAI